MGLDSKSKHKLKKLVKELSSYRGRHTEFISVYIPQGYDLNKIINHLQQEQGTATNIKSKQTRENVINSLEKMIQYLKLYRQTPEHGFAIFSGNVAEREGQQDVRVWSIEPPLPINVRIYRCDKDFKLEPLEAQMITNDVYGLVVMDMRDGVIALLKGKVIQVLKKTHSEVPGKMKAGGQSAQRFARLREGAIKDHFKKVADYMKEEFLHMQQLKGILVGGPGTTVTNFLNKNYITGDIVKKIISKKDLSYTDEFGLQELVDKSADILANEEVMKEKLVMQEFFMNLNMKPGKVSYGMADVRKKIEMGMVDKLLLSEALSDEILDEFSEHADELGSKVFFISTDTREGVQLEKMGKIAAILRYESKDE